MPNIYYSTPFALDRNVGREYNQFCSIVPNGEDWILLRDADTMFLTPDFGKQVAEVVKVFGIDFDLIGCMTNRLRSNNQLHEGAFSNERDILKHIQIAESRKKCFAVRPTTEIAGLFMLFKKSLWYKVKFRENTFAFDRMFCKDVLKIGGKIGIAESIYLFHSYRMWSSDPKNEVSHLI